MHDHRTVRDLAALVVDTQPAASSRTRHGVPTGITSARLFHHAFGGGIHMQKQRGLLSFDLCHRELVPVADSHERGAFGFACGRQSGVAEGD